MSIFWRLQKAFQGENQEFVSNMYRELLTREPDKAGHRDHMHSLMSGRSKFDVLKAFLSSAEFHARLNQAGSEFGASNHSLARLQNIVRYDNEQFVMQLYSEVLNREPDSSGMNAQLGAISHGYSKNMIAKAVLASDELRIKLTSAQSVWNDKISIIVAAHHSVPEVKACVESLKQTIVHMPYEIILVDNGSDYDVREALYYYAKSENIHLILKPGIDSVGETFNTGIRMANGSLVLLTSCQVSFQEPGWLENLYETINASPNIGIIQTNIQNGQFVSNDAWEVNQSILLARKLIFDEVGFLSNQSIDATFTMAGFCESAAKKGWRTFKKAAIGGNFPEEWIEAIDADISPFNYMEVVYVLELTGVSGGIKDVFEHVNRLHDLGYRVHLFALDGQPTWFPLKVQVRRFSDYPSMVQTLKQMNALKVATWWKTLSVVMESCDASRGGRGIPFYFIQDIEESYYPNEPKMRALVLQTYHQPVHFITIADWTAMQLENRFSRKAANVSIGVDLTIFNPKRTNRYNPKSILACSRKSQHLKGFHVTTEAVKQVFQSMPDVLFKTFGVELPDVTGIPTEHASSPSDEEIASLYSNCGVFVQTSKHEGFGLPILEAMACGAPVVTTKADGNEEFCLDGYNCLKVESGDSNKVAECIMKLLNDKEYANYLASNGRQTALRYHWAKVMYRLNNVFGNFANEFHSRN